MKLIKEIKSKTGELHFKRYEILKTRWGSIYLHKIYKADEDMHLHSHPWNYVSMVLKGSFIEEVEGKYNHMKRFDMVFRKSTKYHKIKELLSPYVVTLFFVSNRTGEWGYNVNEQFVQHEEYRIFKNLIPIESNPIFWKNIINKKLVILKPNHAGCLELNNTPVAFNYGVIKIENDILYSYTYDSMKMIQEYGKDYFDSFLERLTNYEEGKKYFKKIPLADIKYVAY